MKAVVPFKCLLFLIVFHANTLSLWAQLPDLLSVRWNGLVHRWDIETDEQSYATSGPSWAFGAIARTLDGRYLAARGDNHGDIPGLYEINPDNGSMSWYGMLHTDLSDISAMTVTPCGNLFAWQLAFDSDFFLIDPRTLQHQIVPITLSNGAMTSHSTSSLATSPDGRIYSWTSGFVTSQGVFSKLFEIDIDAGVANEIGGFEFMSSSENMQLAFAPDGRLFGFTDVNGGGPLVQYGIYEIDLQTGVPALIRTGPSAMLGSIRGAEFVFDEPAITLPHDISITTGSLDSGGLPELCVSDDNYLVVDPMFSQFRYQLAYTIDAVAPSDSPAFLQFNYESRTFNVIGSVEQRIELFNYQTGQYENVDTRNTSLVESVVSIAPGGDPARFVEAGTNAMRARISYQNSLPFWVFVFSVLFLPYETSVDQIFWQWTP